MLPLEYFRQDNVSHAPAKKLITSEDIKQQTAEFLARGGTIKEEPANAWQVHNPSRVSITINPEKQHLLNTKPPKERKVAGASKHKGIQKSGNKWRAVVGRHFVGEYTSIEQAFAAQEEFIKSLREVTA